VREIPNWRSRKRHILLGNATGFFYDDRNTASAGRGDYALITDFNNGEDAIKLNGSRADYRLAPSPTGLPTGTAIYLNKPGSEQDELIAIVQRNSGLNLNSSYFKFTDDEFNLSSLNGSNGFKLNGIDAYDISGSSVSGAGDVNGDGFEDIIIGTSSADENYVVFGKAGGFDASLNLSALNGSNGFVINGKDVGDFTLAPVSRAGDVNGDGLSDLIIGDSLADSNGQNYAGSSYVVFGRAGGFGTSFNLSSLNGSNGFVINGIDAYDNSGRSVSDVGDVNGDGFDDIIIGASGADPNGSSYNNGQSATGSSYLVFGKAEGFSSSLNLSTLNGSNGFTINSIIN
jgi:hypothetical protein